ncbi:MAG: hypothetical protein VX185_16690 [Pseudomonadota bacterium]|nr:hypothetical protein [Pseudomonadota bacterium]
MDSHAQQLAQLLGQLWSHAGLNASIAALVFKAMPALQHLLQPIEISADINAYCLTKPLIQAQNALSQLGEWQLALLGLNPEMRGHWLQLAAARCREAGAMADPQVLVKLIQQLGGASQWVLAALNSTDVTPLITQGPLAQTERELLGYSLHENAAIPALCRILRACFILQASSSSSARPVSAMQRIETNSHQLSKHLASNWCAGRVLALPQPLLSESSPSQWQKPNAAWVLLSQPVPEQASPLERFAQQPWLFLLCVLGFVQDAWAAEQRGGLVFSLPLGQNAFAPSQVSVAVQGVEGDEVSLGSLATFIVQLLGELNIALYPSLTQSVEAMQQLDRALSPMIGELLGRKMWQFIEAGRHEPGHYRLHPDLSDACYSLPLAPVFGIKSQRLQQTIKQLALKGYAEKGYDSKKSEV